MRPTHFVAVLASTLALALSTPAQKMPDVRADRGPVGTDQVDPDIAASGDNVYVVWEDKRNATDDVYFNRSTDAGRTWQTTDVRLNAASPATDPEILAAGNSAYVVYNGNGGVRFNRSLDGGATWLPTDTLIGAFAVNPILAASGSFVYVVYIKSSGVGGQADLYCRRSTDSGSTWQPEQRIDTDPAGSAASITPKITASGNSVYVSWRDLRDGVGDVYFNGSNDNGATWFPSDRRLNTGVPAGTVETYFSVEIAAADNNVYVIWWDDRNAPGQIKRDVFVQVSQDRGVTWQAAGTRLDTDAPGNAESHFPHVAASGSSAWVVWAEFRNGDGDVYMNRTSDNGSTWLANDVRLDSAPPGEDSGVLQIAAGPSSPYIAFEDTRDGGVSLYFNRSVDDGATWLPFDVPLTAVLGQVGFSLQEIAVSGDQVYVVYDDQRNGSWDIYMNIPFGFQPYGSGKPGTGGIAPTIAGGGQATIGETVSIDITDGLGGATGALLIGGPGTQTALPLLGGTLWVIPQFAPPFPLGGTPGVAGAGSASFPLAIPLDPALVGAVLYYQPVVLDPAATAGLSMGSAIEVWIG